MGLGGAQMMVKGILETYNPTDHYVLSLRKASPEIKLNFTNFTCSKSKSKFSFRPLWELKKNIKTNNIDIIHTYLLKSQIFAWLIKLLFFPKIKIITHEHGVVLLNDKWYYKLFLKLSAKHTNLFIAASLAVKKALLHKGNIPSKKITILYNYIIFKNFQPTEIKKLPNKVRLGYAGRLNPEKGCIHLINAIPKVKANVEVKIAGTGPEENALIRTINELKIGEKIAFLGYVENMHNFYSQIDVLVIPSEFEAFGLIAIEAQSMGIPVIAADIPGLNEVVLNNINGITFEKKNPNDLAKKIDELIQNQNLREQLINNGFKNATQFNIESYHKKLNQAYKTLFDEK